MSPLFRTLIAGGIGAAAAVALVVALPMPVPFDGATVVISAVLAFLLTLSLTAWMPVGWLWTDSERIRKAFQAHHGLSSLGTDNALDAITQAHNRASMLRAAAVQFHTDLRQPVIAAADRLDASAREIFYTPSRLSALRQILARSELIEDATRAHKALRARTQEDDTTARLSREQLMAALSAMEAAFAASDLSVARGHLEQVKVASSVAETLFAPRHPIFSLNDGDQS